MRSLSNTLLNELHSQESADPFLTLITLSHSSFGVLRYVNDVQDVVSNSNTFTAFPVKITLPSDDGETLREVEIVFDNVSLELIDELRAITDPIEVKLEMVLRSVPDTVEIELDELKLVNITYNTATLRGKLVIDNFLNTELSSEKYTPTNYPGLFS